MKLGIVGCGGIAVWTAALARLNRKVQLAACCDQTAEIAGRFARRFGIRQAFGSYAEMLAEADLDAVYLAVPHHLHAPMIRQALAARRHVWCEKPIARTYAEGQEVAALARQSGCKVGINYQYRYDPACWRLVRRAHSGQLGQIYYGRCNVAFHREAGYYEKSAWHARKDQAGGGTLLTVGSHMLDILLWAAQSAPRAAVGMTAQARFQQVEVEDLAQGTVELDNGALLQVCSSMVATPERPVSCELYGAKGSSFYRNGPLPDLRFLDALGRSLEGFRAWVEAERPYRAPAEAALPVLAAVEAIYRAAESGGRAAAARPDERLE